MKSLQITSHIRLSEINFKIRHASLHFVGDIQGTHAYAVEQDGFNSSLLQACVAQCLMSNFATCWIFTVSLF